MVDQDLRPTDEIWKSLRTELEELYFEADGDPDPEAAMNATLLAEAVLAYETMSEQERQNDSGRDIIRSVSKKLTLEDVAREWKTLVDHKKKILDVIGQLFKRPTFVSGTKQKVGYNRVQFKGQNDVKEVLFVPKGMTVPASIVNEEVLDKWHWKMNRPNLMVKIECGTRHPSALSTPLLVNLPAFKDHKEAAETAVRKISPDVSKEQLVRLTAQQIDDFLKTSVSEEVLPGILDGAKKSKNWIVVDRRTPKASSPSAELLLENCLGLTPEAQRPTVLVFDSFTRYKGFKPSRLVNSQLLLLGDIVYKSIGGYDTFEEERQVVEQLYKASDFDRWQQYHVQDPVLLNDPKSDKLWIKEGDKRLLREPEDVMVARDDDGNKLTTSNGQPLITPQLKWMFHYRQYLWPAGSHYVIFEDATDSELTLKSGGKPWPEGMVFASGQNVSFERIQETLSAGIPTVMLYNTGGVAQTFGSLHKLCVTGIKEILDECKRSGEDPDKVILQRTDFTSVEPWVKKVDASFVKLMQRLAKQASMRKSVLVIDFLKESPEQVAQKIMGCFAAGVAKRVNTQMDLMKKSSADLGLSEEDVVLGAWNVHMVLTSKAKSLRRQGDLMFYFNLLLTLGATSLAILETDDGLKEYIGWLGTLVSTITFATSLASCVVVIYIKKLQCLRKWGACKTASTQIVAEIYKYRIGVLEYRPPKQQEGDDGAGTKLSRAGTSLLEFNASETFELRIEEINRFAKDMVGKEMRKLSEKSQIDFSDDTKRDKFKKKLAAYVPSEVLGNSHQSLEAVNQQVKNAMNVEGPPKKKKKGSDSRDSTYSVEVSVEGSEEDSKPVQEKEQKAVNAVEPDDFYSLGMNIETYHEYRTKPLLRYCEDSAPQLAKRLSSLELWIIIIGASGTAISALGYYRWVAVVVIVVACLMNTKLHEALQLRLSATLSASRMLADNKMFMESLSYPARQLPEIMQLCVNQVESAIIETTTAWTGMAFRPDGKPGGEDPEPEEGSPAWEEEQRKMNKKKGCLARWLEQTAALMGFRSKPVYFKKMPKEQLPPIIQQPPAQLKGDQAPLLPSANVVSPPAIPVLNQVGANAEAVTAEVLAASELSIPAAPEAPEVSPPAIPVLSQVDANAEAVTAEVLAASELSIPGVPEAPEVSPPAIPVLNQVDANAEAVTAEVLAASELSTPAAPEALPQGKPPPRSSEQQPVAQDESSESLEVVESGRSMGSF